MLVRTFSGEDLPGVLTAVKKEFGPAALILSQRRVADGSGGAGRGVELTAAYLEAGESTETLKGMGITPLYAPKSAMPNRTATATMAGATKAAAVAASAPRAVPRAVPAAVHAPVARAVPRAVPPAVEGKEAGAPAAKKSTGARRFLFWGHSAYQKQQEETEAPVAETPAESSEGRGANGAHDTPAGMPALPAAASLRSELDGLRAQINEINQSLGGSSSDECVGASPRRRGSRLQRAIETLGVLGLEPEYARDAASEWFDLEDRDKPAPRAEIEAALRKGIEILCAANSDVSPIPAKGPRVIAVVGPTGAGKTTTIAKIAARELLGTGRRVALLTCDTFRIAAIEQLRMYARIIGVPMRIVEKPEDFRVALAAYRDYDLILMDTPGLSPRLKEPFDKLHTILAAHGAAEKLLVLSSATKTEELLEAWRSFSALEIDRLIISKSDETIRFGCLIPVLKAAKIPVAFVTNGQRVPEDLIPATPAAVCQLFDALWRAKPKNDEILTA